MQSCWNLLRFVTKKWKFRFLAKKHFLIRLKISIFNIIKGNFDFERILRFLINISILYLNFDLYKVFHFLPKFRCSPKFIFFTIFLFFCQQFLFLTKIFIFGENFRFWRFSYFLSKISIFDVIIVCFDFWPFLDFLAKNTIWCDVRCNFCSTFARLNYFSERRTSYHFKA
mgnify:CR=1 FL=1